MNIEETKYIEAIEKILKDGHLSSNRTGINSYKINNVNLSYDLSKGFPLFTHRKNFFKVMGVELEGFINGIESKKWYKDRGCNIWNDWCDPSIVPYSNDISTRLAMSEEDSLGKIYGAEWRDYNNDGIDQLKNVINKLKTEPFNRRMVVTSWNPSMDWCKALPACHMMWGLNVIDDKLHLNWVQRSCDILLGHATITYALLLHLLCKETGYNEGSINVTYWDCHIYENQIEQVKEIINRKNKLLDFPSIETTNFTSIFDWKHSDSKIVDYKSLDKINIPIAI